MPPTAPAGSCCARRRRRASLARAAAASTLAEAAEFALAVALRRIRSTAAISSRASRRPCIGSCTAASGSARRRVLEAPDLDALAELGARAAAQSPGAAVITAVRRKLGAPVPIIGVFDTAYYTDLPQAAIHYAVPQRWRDEFGIRRYGFHGMAHRYLCQVARARLPNVARNGSDRQPAARARLLRDRDTRGRAIATSMGFTPLEGLGHGHAIGRSRSGSDLVCHGAQRHVSGRCETRTQPGERPARTLGQNRRYARVAGARAQRRCGAALAIEVFCRRASHFVAAYIAELGGVDASCSAAASARTVPRFGSASSDACTWAGIALQPQANAASVSASNRASRPRRAAPRFGSSRSTRRASWQARPSECCAEHCAAGQCIPEVLHCVCARNRIEPALSAENIQAVVK
jgi:hypothetical protein